MQTQVTAALGRFAAETGADRIPPAAISSAKLKFLDTLAVTVAGSRHRSSIISLEVAKQLGGNPHCTIVGRNERTSVELAGYVNASGLDKASPHILRHTFCKNLVDAGVGLEQVAALAGHESLETTRRYCEPSLKDLQKAVDLVGEEE